MTVPPFELPVLPAGNFPKPLVFQGVCVQVSVDTWVWPEPSKFIMHIHPQAPLQPRAQRQMYVIEDPLENIWGPQVVALEARGVCAAQPRADARLALADFVVLRKGVADVHGGGFTVHPRVFGADALLVIERVNKIRKITFDQ